MNYTQGKWRLKNGKIVSGYCPDEALIAELNEDEYEDVVEANANLIVAAPEMYEALKLVKKYLDRPYSDGWYIVVNPLEKPSITLGDVIDKALAKAKGKDKK